MNLKHSLHSKFQDSPYSELTTLSSLWSYTTLLILNVHHYLSPEFTTFSPFWIYSTLPSLNLEYSPKSEITELSQF